jgi:hypothetical protein
MGKPIRMPIRTAAMAALPTTAERGMRMRFGLSPLENPTEYTQDPAGILARKFTITGPVIHPDTSA